MKAFWAVIKKELTSVGRDRTIGIALLIQLFIASFSSALLIGMLSLYDADSAGMYGTFRINAAVVGGDTALLNGDTALLNGYLSERNVDAIPFARLEDAEGAFYQGQIQAILVLPADSGDLVQMKLYLPADEAARSMILNFLQEPLKRYENALREKRGLYIRYTGLKGKPPTTFEFIYSAILPILMFFPAFVAGGMVIDSVSEEVENNTLDTLLSAPLTLTTAIGAKICAALLLTLGQCLAWLGLLSLNQISIQNWGWVLLVSIICAGIIAVGAAIVTLFFRDRERSQFVYSLTLLAGTSLTLLANLSPIRTLSRFATGDAVAARPDVLVFTAVLAALLLLFLRLTTTHRQRA